MLRIHLFGHLRLFVSDEPLKFSALPKTLPLWAYLLLNRNTPMPRDSVAFKLWPDVPEKEARANLRRHLYELRRKLPPTPKDRPWLLTNSRQLQWNPEGDWWLDVADFEHFSGVGRLSEAVALYTGDLLPELYENFLFFERERLRNLLFANLDQLIELHRGPDDYRQAMRYAQQLLTIDALREDTVRELMSLRFMQGSRARALADYQDFKERVEQELGVPPMPETEALYQTILKGVSLVGASKEGRRQEGQPQGYAPTERAPNNLPAQLTPLLGRLEELAVLCEMIGSLDSGVRLLTLTGVGGTGKTRLCLEVGLRLLAERVDSVADGIYFVPLAPISEPELVIATIAEKFGVKEKGRRSLMEKLKEHLAELKMLLVLDNFEQVVTAAPQIADLLAAAPGLRVLVTSRCVLDVYGEHEFQLEPLPLPALLHTGSPPLEKLTTYAAVALFVERARAVKRNFVLTDENAPAVVEICRHLDGLPLAIELAAARSKFFSPQAMLKRLTNRRLAFLTSRLRNVPPRQRTLRATIDWSYNLLSPEEQALFARLAVFVGEFTLSAAEAVVGDEESFVFEGITTLVDSSMVQPATPLEPFDEPCFRLLLILREYALEQLATSGFLTPLQKRHAQYYLRLTEEAETKWRSPEENAWLNRLEAEHDNLRAALKCSLAGADVEIGLKLTAGLQGFWHTRGYWTEALHWFKESLQKSSGHTPRRAKFLQLTGITLSYQGKLNQAIPFLEQSVEDFHQLGKTEGVAKGLYQLGRIAVKQNEYQQANKLLEESLALYQKVDEPHGMSYVLDYLGTVAVSLGHYERATALYEQTLALARSRYDKPNISFTLNSLGELARLRGEYEQAARFYHESLTLARQLKYKVQIAMRLHNLGHVALHRGKQEQARELFSESLTISQQLADQELIIMCLAGLGGVATSEGRLRQAVRLFGAVAAHFSALSIHLDNADQAEYDHYLTAVQAQLEPEAYAAAWQAGRGMTLEEAVRLGLEAL